MALAITIRENEVLKIGDAVLFFKKREGHPGQYTMVIEAPKTVVILRERHLTDDEKKALIPDKCGNF